MKHLTAAIILALSLTHAPVQAARHGFLTAPRAKKALKKKEATLKAAFKKRGLSYPPHRIFLRIFKKDGVLELWARSRTARVFTKVKDYPVCYASGRLGPKRRQGDRQVPEGVYHVNVLNPWSAYHLSLGISYPNRSDRILGRRHKKLGGAIMIHGDCVSIGCVAITDTLIEEVYVAAARASSRGQHRIPVHIFPTRLDARGMGWLKKRYTARSGKKTIWGTLGPGQRKRWDRRRAELLAFWKNLQPIYTYFEEHKVVPRVTVSRRGRYVLKVKKK